MRVLVCASEIPLAQRTLEYDLFGDDDSSEEDVVESDEEVVSLVNEGGDEIEPPSEVVTNEPDAVQPLAIGIVIMSIHFCILRYLFISCILVSRRPKPCAAW